MNGTFDFGEAIRFLKAGQSVTRKGWNAPGQYLSLQRPDASSKMTLAYVYINTGRKNVGSPNARVPWQASQTDMLAEDWTIITPK